MIKQKRSYPLMNKEGEIGNPSDAEGVFKRPRNRSASSNRSFGSCKDEENEKDEIMMKYCASGTTTEMRIPYCLLLPNRAIGFVIGKSGSNVREIEKACGAIIKCQKEFDVVVHPPPSEKILTIFGKKENKKKALELVLGKSKTVMDFQEEDGKESIVIIVPTRSIPIIIGQKGSKIASLSEQSGCEINVHKDDVPGIKDKAIFIKAKNFAKIIDCISIIYDLLEDIVDNGILSISEFPGVPKNGAVKSAQGGGGGALPDASSGMGMGGGGSGGGAAGGPNSHFHQGGGSSHNHFNHDVKYNMKKNDNSNSFEYMNGDDYDNFSVPKERNLLLHKFGKEASACVIRFVLDVETTAWIIGKAGCHIKEIRTITGAGAVIVDAPDNIENVKTCDRILTLSGSAENKFNALKLIVRQIEEREKNINHPMRMLVPGKAASFLIGRKGSIIKYITDMSGSQIQVAKNKESENEKLVLISGSPDAKILASILVLQKLEEYENPAIAREGLLIPLNDVIFSLNTSKHGGVKKGNNNSYSSSGVGGNHGKPGHNNHHTNMNNDRYYSSGSNPNNHYGGRGSSPHAVNGSGYGAGGNHSYDDNNMHSQNNNYNNSLKNPNDMKDKVEKMFLQQLYKSFPISSLPKILSVTQPYTIELNMPDVYLETFDSQNKNGKSLIEEIIEKSGCNISICTDTNDSSSYTFILSITGSPLANSIAILMIQAKIFQFDWF
ncbi:hypothetical protein AK88_01409 [Plasmodium fragile]|uniref:K Homology domain-containing protein n=1 Tax=Plasmodium fragile TaxID=5857 RepID=A0A0D9QP87_PLAFR|nr:uncharacterized protein AK88_01409 [Plasmodium fragile]KJP88915.1 hypothetical protein AK88_01409 [Plasmodium fragile]